RGHFARAFCQKEFAAHGLTQSVAQANVSFNHERGTLRGMHYQAAPYQEVKIVRCTRGAIFDVAVDVRPDSSTYGNWMGVTLTPENGRAFYVPEGCAHGYLCLEDDSEVLYLTSAFYAPEAERGLRYDDPAIGIEWPIEVAVMSEKDRRWPAFQQPRLS
ncbi:MAG: dTDP-4-dehydrorhamnose 3,5-epimerase, partial [Salinivenus sp.]